MSISLGELAVRFGCELHGDPQVAVDRVATLDSAQPGAVTFLANPLYREQLPRTRASVVILDAASVAQCPVASLVSSNPYATYARVATLLHPWPVSPAGIHPSAVVAPDAQVHSTAHVGALAVIGARSKIAARASVGPHCVIEEGVTIAEDVHLAARVTLCRGVEIGARTFVQAGAVVGGDGFGFAQDEGAWIKVPQLGTVRIGADVEIGANTTIDRGAIGDTAIHDGAKLDNQIQVGHNVQIGEHTAIAACVGISGSTRIGKRCMIGGAVGIVGHLTICDDVAITGFTMVSRSIREPGVYSGGIPAEDARAWRRIVARLKRIDIMGRRISALERVSGIAPQQEDNNE
jgi:UDP-3-O-[3-hydroxymyristoyl] glucosamine N-acyltransferase